MLARFQHHISKFLLTLFATLVLLGCSDSSDNSQQATPKILPIIFVHGQFGSAQQFESQAMRFTSNDYPQSALFSFEYDTGSDINPLADLDAFVDEVLAETGSAQVYAIGHSRGTTMWTTYLDSPEFNGPDKVAKYVNVDGRDPLELPGGVDSIGIWGEWNSANSGYNRKDNQNAQIGPYPENNYYFPDKSHTEVATSAEAFAVMYEFLAGVKPAVANVTPKQSGENIQVAGRALLFPQNESNQGSLVEIREVEPANGQRVSESPLASFAIDESGHFGPVTVTSGTTYELALHRPATDSFPEASIHHFYLEPFTHDNFFVRLLSSRPGEGIAAFIPRSEHATGALVMRQREFWGDQGGMRDELYIDGLNVLTPAISPRAANEGAGVNLAVFAFDDGGDMVTDLEKGELSPFNAISFLTAADVYVPADPAGMGYFNVRLVTRGTSTKEINVPNRPGALDRNTVIFRDDTEQP